MRFILLPLLAAAVACADPVPSYDCTNICEFTLIHAADDAECDVNAVGTEECVFICGDAIGTDEGAMQACYLCVSETDNYCGEGGCDDDCGGFIADAIGE